MDVDLEQRQRQRRRDRAWATRSARPARCSSARCSTSSSAREQRYGLATLCIGGGMGIATDRGARLMSDIDHPLGQGRRRHRHAHARRPDPVRQHDERGLRQASMAATVDRLEAEKDDDHRGHHHLGQEDLLRRRRPRRPRSRRRRPRTRRGRARGDAGSRASCAGWRRSASRSSPRSTAPRSAAVSRSRWPAHHRIAVDDPSVEIGFPEVTLGLLPGGGGVVRARCACSASPTR